MYQRVLLYNFAAYIDQDSVKQQGWSILEQNETLILQYAIWMLKDKSGRNRSEWNGQLDTSDGYEVTRT